MDIETNKISYKFIGGFDSTSKSATEIRNKKISSGVAAGVKAGYLLTDIAGYDDVRAFKFTLFPELEAAKNIKESGIKTVGEQNFAKLETEIEKQADLGKDIINISYGDGNNQKGTWNATFGKADNPVVYYSSDDIEEFEDFIANAVDDDSDLSLLDIDYGNGTWVATAADFEGKKDNIANNTAVSGNSRFDKLTGQIDRQLEKGDVSLVDLEYGDGVWIARYDSGLDLDDPLKSSYFSSKNYKTFKAEAEAQRDKGFNLVDVEYVKGAWYGVFNEEAIADVDSESAYVADNLGLAAIESDII